MLADNVWLPPKTIDEGWVGFSLVLHSLGGRTLTDLDRAPYGRPVRIPRVVHRNKRSEAGKPLGCSVRRRQVHPPAILGGVVAEELDPSAILS
jgi:hypothetical protein